MMTTMVYFTAAGADYCLPVSAALAVRRTSGMVCLPAAGTDIAGVLPGDPPLTVISPLGGGGDQVLVVEAADRTFGLLVEAVTGLRRVLDAEISARPTGQDRPLVSGTVQIDGQLVLIADPDALAGRYE
jgi:hypothetical protein